MKSACCPYPERPISRFKNEVTHLHTYPDLLRLIVRSNDRHASSIELID